MLNEWAKRHGVSEQAMFELRVLFLSADVAPLLNTDKTSEAHVQNLVRSSASAAGWRLYRNNVGAGVLDNGSFVRWGLANDSAHMNKYIKSSDLIGIKPLLIIPEMVGYIIGQFVSRECKHNGWKFKGTDHETAQLRWIEIINALGGDAKFTTGDL